MDRPNRFSKKDKSHSAGENIPVSDQNNSYRFVINCRLTFNCSNTIRYYVLHSFEGEFETRISRWTSAVPFGE